MKSNLKPFKKFTADPHEARRLLEPGPVLLVSSHYHGETDIMTMGWHLVMENEAPQICCYIWDQNRSRYLIEKSRECVFNVPTLELAPVVSQIGNCSGVDVDKFVEFSLSPVEATRVKAPLIAECYASYEARLVNRTLAKKYSLFVFEIVAAHVARTPKWPKTIHYRGGGEFMVAGETTTKYRRFFDPAMLKAGG